MDGSQRRSLSSKVDQWMELQTAKAESEIILREKQMVREIYGCGLKAQDDVGNAPRRAESGSRIRVQKRYSKYSDVGQIEF